MTLLRRRFRLFWARFISPGVLESDPHFRDLLRGLTHQGLQVMGGVTFLGAIGYTIYRFVVGDGMMWNEDGSISGSVQLWDKMMLAGLSLGLVGLGRMGTGLRRGRLFIALFVVVVAWFIVLRNFEPGNRNMSAAWLTLTLFVAAGAVPFRPWQMMFLGLGVTAEFWYFAAITPGMSGDTARLVFLLLTTGVATVIAASLHAGRHQQYRALRRVAQLRDYASARSTELARLIQRERGMQDQLVQAEKLASLGQLTAGIAHEIKNPLNFVTNFASLSSDLAVEVREALTEDPNRPAGEVVEEIGESLEDLVLNTEKIAEHGRRADGIVKSMLAHSRATPGERRLTDLNKLLDEYVGLAYHGMRARHAFNVEIERTFDPQLPEVPTVPEELGRVFLNLLGNALDALRERAGEDPGAAPEEWAPTLRVSTREAEGSVVIYISDNGTGMPSDVVEHVFEPFFTTKPSGEGTGLGLSLAYEIITAGHGGSLDVRSREGEGTVFSITLPLEPPGEPEDDAVQGGDAVLASVVSAGPASRA